MLYDLSDYPVLASVIAFPIVAIEARALAHHYPLVWRKAGEGHELIALISLSAPHDYTLRRDFELGLARPLLLEAFPLSVALADANDPRGTVLIEEAETREGAQGEAIFAESGTPSAAAARRLSALEVYAGDHARTHAYTRALSEHGLLIDWPLRLKIGDSGLEFDGLSVLAPPQARMAGLKAAISEHGFSLAELVTLHDLSLFNMQRLVDRHRVELALARAGAIMPSPVDGAGTRTP